MLIPGKYEATDKSLLVIGAAVLRRLEGRCWLIESLYAEIFKEKKVVWDLFVDSLVFLYLIDSITIDGYFVERLRIHET